MSTHKPKKKVSASSIFVTLVLIFAAWTYFSEYKGTEKREAEKAASLKLLQEKPEELIKILLRDLSQPVKPRTFLAHRDLSKKDWIVETPYSDLGDTTAFESFLNGIFSQNIKETVVEAPDISWKTYGLDQPQAEAEFTFKTSSGEKTKSIKIGSVPAFDGSVYGRLGEMTGSTLKEENRVVLLESLVEAFIKKDAKDLRDKRVFPADKTPDFHGFTLAASTGTFTGTFAGTFSVTKDDKGKWMFKSNTSYGMWPLDSSRIDRFIQSLLNLKSHDIWSEDKTNSIVRKGRKLDHPAISVQLTPKDSGNPWKVFVAPIGKNEALTAATSSERPVVMALNKEQFDDLNKSANDFLDMSYPFHFAQDSVKSLELFRPERRNQTLALGLVDKNWTIVSSRENKVGHEAESVKREVSQESVEKFLSQLGRIQALKVLPKSTKVPGFSKRPDDHGFQVVLKDGSGKLIREVRFVEGGDGEMSGKFYGVSSLTPGFIFSVEKSFIDDVPMELLKPLNSASLSKGEKTVPGESSDTPPAAMASPGN